MKEKYLILTASYWSWHNSAKNAINNYLKNNNKEVIILDLVDFLSKNWKITQNFYSFASEKIPLIWQISFIFLDTKFINLIIKKYLELFYSEKFNNFINEIKPHFIIWVYPIWQYFIWNYISSFNKNFSYGVFITDSTISLPWYNKDKFIDKFFVIDSFTKNSLEEKIPNRKKDIINTFFPIEEKYFNDKVKLNNKKIFLLLTWLKSDFVINFLDNISNMDFYDEIVILKWRNENLYNKLKYSNKNNKFKFLDFINIKENLKNIDIFISKPGWALVSECIASSVFMIIPSYIKWQEDGNIKLLEDNKLWFYSKNIFFIKDFLKNWYKNIDMNNFSKIKNKFSIKNIIDNLK